jgi:hypothetical protein
LRNEDALKREKEPLLKKKELMTKWTNTEQIVSDNCIRVSAIYLIKGADLDSEFLTRSCGRHSPGSKYSGVSSWYLLQSDSLVSAFDSIEIRQHLPLKRGSTSRPFGNFHSNNVVVTLNLDSVNFSRA